MLKWIGYRSRYKRVIPFGRKKIVNVVFRLCVSVYFMSFNGLTQELVSYLAVPTVYVSDDCLLMFPPMNNRKGETVAVVLF